MKLVQRDVPPRTAWALEQAGVPPLLARLYAARGVVAATELDDGLAQLLPRKASRHRRRRPVAGRRHRARPPDLRRGRLRLVTAPPPAA